MHFHTDPFGRLSPEMLYAALKLRQDVFMLEQDCLYPELDGLDPHCLHVTGTLPEEAGTPKLVAYARLVPPGLKFPEVSIGRIVVDPRHRGHRHGQELVEVCLGECASRFKGCAISIEAQYHLREFYGSLGFRETGPKFLLDGILHVNMLHQGT